jgi:hypothetical protein
VQLLFLALEAALYPTLLAAVVILLAQPRPARLLGAYLAGGLTISIGLGLVIVFALSDAVNSQSSGLSWGADLAIGGLALLLAVVLATRADDRFRERRKRRAAVAAGGKAAATNRAAATNPPADKKEPWSERILARGSVPIVFAAGLAINVPGAAYLIGLKDIAAGNHGTAADVALIVGFNLIMFMLAEIPLLGLWLAPERTNALVEAFNEWLSSHGREIAIVLCALLGVFLIARGIAES